MDLVGDVERFAVQYWGRSIHRYHTTRARDLAGLLSVDDIDTLVNSTIRTPMVRVAQAGRRVGETEYTAPVRIAGRELHDVVDAASLHRCFVDGHTIVLQALHRTWPPIRRLAHDLEAQLDHPVQVNAYLSPPNAAALPRHADVHDVIVVHLVGSKEWSVDGLPPFAMVPGDTMYLPRGVAHAAWTDAEHSLHLTVGIPAISYRDVARSLLDRIDIATLDRPLPIGFTRRSDADLRSALWPVLSELSRAAAPSEHTIRTIIGHERRRVRVRQQHARTPALSSLVSAELVGEHTVLRRRSESVAQLSPAPDDDGRAVMTIGDTTLRVPSYLRPALEVVVSRDVVTSGDLPMLTRQSAIVLLKRLVREGLLEHPACSSGVSDVNGGSSTVARGDRGG